MTRVTEQYPNSIWITLFCIAFSEAKYFSAISKMNDAFEVGQKLSDHLNTYLEMEMFRLARIRQVRNEISMINSHGNLNETKEELLNYPVNAYLMIKKLAAFTKVDFKSLLNEGVKHLVKKSSDEDMDPSFSSSYERWYAQLKMNIKGLFNLLPTEDDLDGAAHSLLRVQRTYNLRAADIANGKLTENVECPPLTASQCLHIGEYAYEIKNYPRAEEWFRVAYDKTIAEISRSNLSTKKGDDGRPWFSQFIQAQHQLESTDPDETTPNPIYILESLAYSLGRQSRFHDALQVTQLILKSEPYHEQSLENEEFYKEHLRKGDGIVGPAPPQTNFSSGGYAKERDSIAEALCRGENIFSPPPTNSLYCRYHVPHPYYLIGPVKEEVLYPDPRIVMWYDVIHPLEIKEIKERMRPRLVRGKILNEYGNLVVNDARLCETAQLTDQTGNLSRIINQRIHALTGINMKTAEDLLVSNYGIGGHCASHVDFTRKNEVGFSDDIGNRYATILFYLSDVESGGATVFTSIGAVANPVKGAALLWYNLHPSGEGDVRTQHIACPVLVGSKWIMNVWFHYRFQDLHRPCELTQGPIEPSV